MIDIQVKKEEVKEKIQRAAKAVFLEQGYQKATLRGIAEAAGVTKGNIYIYFKSKDELFHSLVAPTVQILFATLENSYDNLDFNTVVDELHSEVESYESFKQYVALMLEHKEEMTLLLTRSDGSKFSNFRETLGQRYEKSAERYFDMVKRLNPAFKGNVTYLFLHACAQLYVSFIEEIIVHEPSQEELDQYTMEISTFVRCGMAGVMGI